MQRELVVAARRARLQGGRVSIAGTLVIIVLGTFAAWYYWEGGHVSNGTMVRVADQALLWTLAYHGVLVGFAFTPGVMSIAGEKDHRTLDFLLTTRLNNAEIVLGKLASCLVLIVATLAAGLPVMLLLHLLGGVDLRLILLAYGGIASTMLFLTSLSIWISAEAPSGRRAVNLAVLCTVTWLIAPFLIMVFLPRFGLRLPEWAATANAWLLASSPFGVVMKLVLGIGASRGLIESVVWMMGLQGAGTVLFLTGSIVRLRPAYRANVSGEARAGIRERRRPVRRIRTRPPVGDDPILWREIYTSQSSSLMNAIGVLINLAFLAALGYATYYYAKPALLEVWQHGFGRSLASDARPEFNLFIRIFSPSPGFSEPVDVARTEFNLFLRYVTTAITVLTTLVIPGCAAEILTRERAKETWSSLLATPMIARDFLRAAILAAAWRLRELIAILGILWTIGLITGAIHPLGYITAVLELIASTWFLLAIGAIGGIQHQDVSTAQGKGFVLALFLIGSGVLPLLLPHWLNSVLLGAGSPPFLFWQSLVTYREVDLAIHDSNYMPLQWIGIGTGEGPLRVVAACLIGIVATALGGWWVWRYGLAHFDRLVGRPWKAIPAVMARASSLVEVPVDGMVPSGDREREEYSPLRR
jgi:ABC-type transport system involved in multi-copper enzyme maturation permease subunit